VVIAMASEFQVPSSILVGGGAVARLGEVARRLRGQRVLIVCDPGVIKLGLADAALKSLRDAGCAATMYDRVQPDPTDANVAEGLAALRAGRCEALVAVGGGSSLDAAKAIAVAATNDGPLSSFAGIERIAQAGLPVIAVPTTAGTGSEVTKVAVITDSARGVKMMMLSRHLLPAAAIVDFELSLSMPPALTAAVGVDTLTHGIEAYVSRRASAMTDPLALSCVRLCARHLLRAHADGSDREARAAMMLAATQGGMAFANSSVALVHGMSRPIGALFHLAHGLANAVLLATVTRWSVSGAPERYAVIAREVGAADASHGDSAACARLVEWLEALNRDLELPRLGGCLGEQQRARFDGEVARMAQDALASGSPANNPRLAEPGDLVELYRSAW
jgi:alcohol dehydrogenase class IV